MSLASSILQWLQEPVVLKGAVQILAASVAAVIVLGLSRWRTLGLEGEMGLALGRGLIQVLAMGAVLGLLLTVDLVWSAVILAGMIAGAAWISHDRARELPEVLWVSLLGVVVGAGLVIVTMTLAGAIDPTVRNLVPVGSMIIAASMKTNAVALDRFKGELASQRDRIEAWLALGAPTDRAIVEHVRASVRASLIPVVDSLKSLGLVWIPGLMAGMVLSGANPIYAAEYQFVIMAMVFAAGGLTSLVTTTLLGERVFTEADQLRVP